MNCPQGCRWQHETDLGISLIKAGSLCQGWGPLLIRGYQFNNVYYFEEIGYDKKWREHQPGTVLNFLAIEEMFVNETPDYLDFGYGENKYKNILGNDESYGNVSYLVLKYSPAYFLIVSQRVLIRLYRFLRYIVIQLNLDVYIRNLLKKRQ